MQDAQNKERAYAVLPLYSAFTSHVHLKGLMDNNVEGNDLSSLIKCSATSFDISLRMIEEEFWIAQNAYLKK